MDRERFIAAPYQPAALWPTGTSSASRLAPAHPGLWPQLHHMGFYWWARPRRRGSPMPGMTLVHDIMEHADFLIEGAPGPRTDDRGLHLPQKDMAMKTGPLARAPTGSSSFPTSTCRRLQSPMACATSPSIPTAPRAPDTSADGGRGRHRMAAGTRSRQDLSASAVPVWQFCDFGGVDKRVLTRGPRPSMLTHLTLLLVEEGGHSIIDHTVPPDVSWPGTIWNRSRLLRVTMGAETSGPDRRTTPRRSRDVELLRAASKVFLCSLPLRRRLPGSAAGYRSRSGTFLNHVPFRWWSVSAISKNSPVRPAPPDLANGAVVADQRSPRRNCANSIRIAVTVGAVPLSICITTSAQVLLNEDLPGRLATEVHMSQKDGHGIRPSTASVPRRSRMSASSIVSHRAHPGLVGAMEMTAQDLVELDRALVSHQCLSSHVHPTGQAVVIQHRAHLMRLPTHPFSFSPS